MSSCLVVDVHSTRDILKMPDMFLFEKRTLSH